MKNIRNKKEVTMSREEYERFVQMGDFQKRLYLFVKEIFSSKSYDGELEDLIGLDKSDDEIYLEVKKDLNRYFTFEEAFQIVSVFKIYSNNKEISYKDTLKAHLNYGLTKGTYKFYDVLLLKINELNEEQSKSVIRMAIECWGRAYISKAPIPCASDVKEIFMVA